MRNGWLVDFFKLFLEWRLVGGSGCPSTAGW
jgi:hypothetical protein